VFASPRIDTPQKRIVFVDQALDRMRALPGVVAAGGVTAMPFGVAKVVLRSPLTIPGRPLAPGDPPQIQTSAVHGDYFRAMGVPLIQGRLFDPTDTATSRQVVLVSRSAVQQFWPDTNPIGSRVQFTFSDARFDAEVIGVVGDVRHLALEEGSGAEMYLPVRQTEDYASVDLIVRTSLPPGAIASAIRGALTPIEPSLAVNEVITLRGLVDKAVSPRRFVVLLLAGFSLFALVLASLGIYGVISYTVDQRRHEMAIRLALGASVRELRTKIVVQTLRLAGIGMLIGFSVAWIAARAIGGMLYNVTAADPITFAGMLAVLVGVAAIAGYLPARRVSRIDPAVALRAS